MEAAAISVPDVRLGELVAAVVSLREEWRSGKRGERVKEGELIEFVKNRCVVLFDSFLNFLGIVGTWDVGC